MLRYSFPTNTSIFISDSDSIILIDIDIDLTTSLLLYNNAVAVKHQYDELNWIDMKGVAGSPMSFNRINNIFLKQKKNRSSSAAAYAITFPILHPKFDWCYQRIYKLDYRLCEISNKIITPSQKNLIRHFRRTGLVEYTLHSLRAALPPIY